MAGRVGHIARMKRIAAIAAGLAMLLGAAAAGASQFTDLWWKPDESGWGMSLVQQDDVAFLMIYGYAPDGRPVWYVSSDARITGLSGTLPVFSGTLHRGRGPALGGPFDPAQVEMSPVGTVSVETLSSGRLRLHVAADGITFVKELVRLTWREPDAGGWFLASFSLRQATVEGAPYGTLSFSADAELRVDGSELVLRADDEFGRVCEYRGTREQAGKMAIAAGTFSCSAGANGLQPRSGTFQLSDLEVTSHGLTGYLRTFGTSHLEYGRFSAARR